MANTSLLLCFCLFAALCASNAFMTPSGVVSHARGTRAVTSTCSSPLNLRMSAKESEVSSDRRSFMAAALALVAMPTAPMTVAAEESPVVVTGEMRLEVGSDKKLAAVGGKAVATVVLRIVGKGIISKTNVEVNLPDFPVLSPSLAPSSPSCSVPVQLHFVKRKHFSSQIETLTVFICGRRQDNQSLVRAVVSFHPHFISLPLPSLAACIKQADAMCSCLFPLPLPPSRLLFYPASSSIRCSVHGSGLRPGCKDRQGHHRHQSAVRTLLSSRSSPPPPASTFLCFPSSFSTLSLRIPWTLSSMLASAAPVTISNRNTSLPI